MPAALDSNPTSWKSGQNGEVPAPGARPCAGKRQDSTRAEDSRHLSHLGQKLVKERERTLADAAGKAKTAVAPEGPPTIQDLRQWLLVNIAAVLEIDPSAIDASRNLDEYGLDSMQSVCLSGDLERWLNVEISATAIWDYPSIDSLCGYLERLLVAPDPH